MNTVTIEPMVEVPRLTSKLRDYLKGKCFSFFGEHVVVDIDEIVQGETVVFEIVARGQRDVLNNFLKIRDCNVFVYDQVMVTEIRTWLRDFVYTDGFDKRVDLVFKVRLVKNVK